MALTTMKEFIYWFSDTFSYQNPIAQWIEHSDVESEVVGSNLTQCIPFCNFFQRFYFFQKFLWAFFDLFRLLLTIQHALSSIPDHYLQILGQNELYRKKWLKILVCKTTSESIVPLSNIQELQNILLVKYPPVKYSTAISKHLVVQVFNG